VGTAHGDLLHLSGGAGPTTARLARRPGHRIAGIARLGPGRWLVAVLGDGLLEWREGRLVGSELAVGTRFVTALTEHGGETFVGTAYRGLWRLASGRPVRTRFPHEHVASLSSTADDLEVVSGFGRFRRTGRDRFGRIDALRGEVATGSPRLTCAAVLDGTTWIGAFDLRPVDLGLDVRERQLDALAPFGGRLFLGTQGGLLSWRPGETSPPRQLLGAPVHDLDAADGRLSIATSGGLFELEEPEGEPVRLDDGQDAPAHAFFTALRWEGATWAGGMEGLYRVDEQGLRQVGAGSGFAVGWVTDLLRDGPRLLVGTYADGVHVLQEGRVVPAPGLEQAWVPPGGLHRAGGAVWVGSLGRPALRWDQEGLHEVRLPAADVHAVVEGPAGLLALTSEGLLRPSR
jgi:hypothetical protein